MNNEWTTSEQRVNTNNNVRMNKNVRRIYPTADFNQNELKNLYEN